MALNASTLGRGLMALFLSHPSFHPPTLLDFSIARIFYACFSSARAYRGICVYFFIIKGTDVFSSLSGLK